MISKVQHTSPESSPFNWKTDDILIKNDKVKKVKIKHIRMNHLQ